MLVMIISISMIMLGLILLGISVKANRRDSTSFLYNIFGGITGGFIVSFLLIVKDQMKTSEDAVVVFAFIFALMGIMTFIISKIPQEEEKRDYRKHTHSLKIKRQS